MEKVSEFVGGHKEEIMTVGVSTLIYYFYRKYQLSQEKVENQRLHEELIHIRNKKFKEIKRKHMNLIPSEILYSENTLIDEVRYLCGKTSRIQEVPHLIELLKLKNIPTIQSPLLITNHLRNASGGEGILPKESFIYKGSYVLTKNIYSTSKELSSPIEWLLAGPRRNLYFKPSNVRAAIVTCGGLCPGLNVVIRQIFINLNIHYGCPEVWGIPFGYQGVYAFEWIPLNLNVIKNLQFEGGTFMGSSRGGFDAQKMAEALVKRGINQLYVIGGDGTHRGIHVLQEYLVNKGYEISLVGVPKTIDNDIPIIDKSFGFETAVSESIRAIRSAYVESTGVPYGIGLVRLMGRNAGFIAMEASNASRDVDVCLIPEARFNIYGEYGLLEYIYNQLLERKHLVVVVAEGAGTGVQDLSSLQEHVKVDDSGNQSLPDIGAFLKDEIVKYCKTKNVACTLKYIDPTYMIRTVAANSHDVRMCSQLASGAVHGAMAGFTGFTVGHVNATPAMIPVSALFGKQNKVDIKERAWQRVLAGTGQPEFRQE